MEERLGDYMGSKFASKRLPDDVVVHSPSSTAKALGFEPLIDQHSSLMAGNGTRDDHIDSASLINN